MFQCSPSPVSINNVASSSDKFLAATKYPVAMDVLEKQADAYVTELLFRFQITT
jgi:hypothetical protein